MFYDIYQSRQVTIQYWTVHLLHSPYENVKLAIASSIAKGDFHGLAAYLFTGSE